MAFDADIPLGKQTHYSFDYDASLLFAIPRAQSREVFEKALEFNGIDRWTAYELSWLNLVGVPQVAIAEFDFSARSNNLVESKSFKLYLNSLNQTAFKDNAAVEAVLVRDLSACSGAPVVVRLYAVDAYRSAAFSDDYQLLDGLAAKCQHYFPEPQLLRLAEPAASCRQRYKSFIFRSLCPVTSQPDWASIYIDCEGPMLLPESLLQYLVSYRNHQGFHEQCVEMIYHDIMVLGAFSQVQVYARFLRRGGLDINPLRVSSEKFDIAEALLSMRDARQ